MCTRVEQVSRQRVRCGGRDRIGDLRRVRKNGRECCFARYLRHGRVAVFLRPREQVDHNTTSRRMEDIRGQIRRNAQTAHGCDALHLLQQAGVASVSRASGCRKVRIGIHEQVQLRIRQAELDVPRPAIAKKLNRVLGGAWMSFVRQIEREPVVCHCAQQATLVLEQAIQHRWLNAGSLRNGARCQSVPAPRRE